MSGILSNNNYYNLSAQSMKLNGLDVQDEIDSLKNNTAWPHGQFPDIIKDVGLDFLAFGAKDDIFGQNIKLLNKFYFQL